MKKIFALAFLTFLPVLANAACTDEEVDKALAIRAIDEKIAEQQQMIDRQTADIARRESVKVYFENVEKDKVLNPEKYAVPADEMPVEEELPLSPV